MARAPSKILGAAEVKALDLDKQIEEATKEHAKSEKQFKKTLGALQKLLDRRAKKEAKNARPKGQDIQPINGDM